MARRAMNAGSPLPAMACYHCQQCAEKYLKGFLVSRSVEFRPVHDLLYLLQQEETTWPQGQPSHRHEALDCAGRNGRGCIRLLRISAAFIKLGEQFLGLGNRAKIWFPAALTAHTVSSKWG